ncbi:MAG TPA: two-component regulator propeller domain-containing protein [Pyrinomonadaceae bacterium]|nr:two-component regulator propeller domain-containing protein [Pyrinomonadaceae bacterium]
MLFLCVCCAATTAALAQYRIDQWTADDGLPQNSVYSIIQTRDGYLWLATVDGLARFDGVRFSVFNKSNSPGIVNNRFISLFEDGRGDLWAGTEESGVVHFKGGRFEYVDDPGVPRSVSWIESAATGDGTIFHSPTEAIRYRNGADLSLTDSRSSNIKIICRLNTEKRYSECFVDGKWTSFAYSDGSPQEKFISVEQETNPDGSSQVRFVSAAQEANGTVWLITADGRVASAVNGRVTRIYDERDGLPKSPQYLIVGERLALVSKDADDALWLVDLPSMQKELLLKKGTGSFPLDKRKFLSTYADGEGNLWFGTNTDGLFRARKQAITAYSEADGIIDKTVYPIFKGRTGTIWIGSVGLSKYENGTFTAIESTRNFVITAIGEDPLGRVLINNYGRLYVRENDQFVPFEQDKIPDLGFVYAIQSDLENALWIGGEKGLRRFKDGVLTSFTTADGLAGNDVKVVINAREGGLWIGTYDGLTRYKDGKFTSWREADGLPSRTVRALYEEADGTLWIGSYDGGLARFKDGKFTRYSMKTGLPNDGAFQILEDDSRNFWISSNRGIYRVNKDELNDFADGKIVSINSISYGKSDGMLNPECNGGRSPAGIRADDGRLWFPTMDGVAVIDPREIKANLKPPPVVIEDFRIDNKDVESDRSDATSRAEIRIEPSQQNFEIRYTALSFINSENLRFKYKLEGLDNEWTDAGTRRQANFTHVPPGDYTFRVIAANSDNVWNETGASLNIVVIPPFYRTWWFMTLAALAVGLFALLLFRQRIRQINLKHAAELAFSRRLIDSQEQERKRFAAEMHDGLGQSLVIIKNRARLSLKQSDQKDAVLDHLENISSTASHAIHEAKEIAFNLRPHLLDRLGLTKTIESMLDKVFSASEIEYDAFVDNIDGVLEKDSEILLYRIVQECASNIVKHSGATRAVLMIERGDNSVSVKISDNGRGFDTAGSGFDLSKRSFGLVGIAERTRLLGGKLSIESKPGEGTAVSIVIGLHSK